jgi:L-lactate dehydrogenase complex protein LldE
VRVALFVTCFNDTLFPGTGRAVVELLERLGVEVGFPEAQTCCGQMHGNFRLRLPVEETLTTPSRRSQEPVVE